MKALCRAVGVSTVLIVTATISPPPAGATFPGAVGQIAYQYGGFGGPGLCPSINVTDGSGASPRTLTSNCPPVADPTWSADGKVLVVDVADAAHNPTIATLDPGTGTITPLTTTGVTYARDPSLNNDGSVVTFGGGRSAGTYTADIYTVPIAGGTPTNLTNASPNDINTEPRFSPDGTKIAWTRKTGNGPSTEIWVMSATGQNPVSLTTGAAGNAGWPAWSPDGTKLAFASDRNGNFQVFVMNADGGSVRQITTSAANDIQPTWAPDGHTIAFTRGCSSDDCNGFQEQGDIDKVDVTDLSAPGAPVALVATSAPESDPDWGVAPAGPVTHARTVTLGLRKSGTSLVASGRLTATDGNAPCVTGLDVDIQHKTNTGWHTVTSATTGTAVNGSAAFSKKIAGALGTYRAVAPQQLPNGPGGDTCATAISSKLAVGWTKHARTITNFSVTRSGSYLKFAGDLKATDGLHGCAAYMPIAVQKLSGSTWKTVVTTKTGRAGTKGDAHFHAQVKLQHGTFRAVASQHAYYGLDLCLTAVSAHRRY